jgi:hypothetical protein
LSILEKKKGEKKEKKKRKKKKKRKEGVKPLASLVVLTRHLVWRLGTLVYFCA